MAIIYQEQISNQIKLILAVVQQFSNGATLEEIKKATGLNIELRTLQRRAERLITNGALKQTGIKRSAKYYLAQPILYPSIIPIQNEKIVLQK